MPEPDLRQLRIGIVAGEESGDILAAGLIAELLKIFPNAKFEGIAGPRMQALGCTGLFPMEKLAIIGIVEVISSLFSLAYIRKSLINHFVSSQPDLVIGVDAPQFNIGMEERIHSAGIPTMHYVSPTVWAWRHYRIKHIQRAVDHMLVLFPFEKKLYDEKNIPVTFVGHPMADELSDEIDIDSARRDLSLSRSQVVIGLLPGSRKSELNRHADLFVKSAKWLHARNSKIVFVAPFVNRATRQIFEQAIANNNAGTLPITLVDGFSRKVMEASDVLIIASGTASLEAALMRRPMVITYKVSWLTALIFRMFSNIKLYSMPNNLVGYELLPELMQSRATPVAIGKAAEYFVSHPEAMDQVRLELDRMATQLRQNANKKSAKAVADFIVSKQLGKIA
ncbi:MAG: lipid-A-disaccharide synthase [Acidiferrobacterales bacterium]